MMKKLKTESIMNELEGASLFFSKPPPPPPNPEPPPNELPVAKGEQPLPSGPKNAHHHDTAVPRHHGITVSQQHGTTIPQVYGVAIEQVRKAVKEFGKEAATHRFTAQEKKEIADLIYTYKSQGVKTSENEMARIAINFLIEDYKQNGEGSVLSKILAALNA